ncbi:MAG: hypothetical protein CL840_18815 [Crocinitomicaceae bacterium]|nr:hypothetical protein [Crocinitomicaceae bacterium]|tara:strand:+ start:99 stop:512 length:414 start_codon:yes stop_codon:yes gene_type:complete
MQKLISIILTVLLLLSSSDVSYAAHLCEGEFVEVAVGFGNHSLDCGMSGSKETTSDGSDEQASFAKKCCENLYVSIDTDHDYQLSRQNNINDVEFTFVKPVYFVNPNNFSRHQKVYHGLAPPLLIRDFQVAFQTFLI